ncbi:MAG: peptidoglycan-binding protein [Candidatus Ryanbacteria bacterium]|nr:peptidoglycan-binding protein [Candidatus Ryanbacteria bacterium]
MQKFFGVFFAVVLGASGFFVPVLAREGSKAKNNQSHGVRFLDENNDSDDERKMKDRKMETQGIISNLQTSISTTSPMIGARPIIQLTIFLDPGARGDVVKILQSLLAADPDTYPEGIISGYFGPLTAKAVRKFQKKEGLDQVGRVGPKTLKKLNKYLQKNYIAFEDSDGEQHVCAIVPPGHLIAPGWLRKQGGIRPIVPTCQILPLGILKKLLGSGTSTGGGGTSTPDIIAPTISNVTATSTTASTTQITWLTNELSTSRVWYATSTPVIAARQILRAVSPSLVLSHILNLSNLLASTTYYYLASSSDAAGNTATSTEQSFLTLP